MKFGLSDDIYEKIKKIADKYNKYKFKIFGSRARGDYRSNSDIDIAIEGNIDKKDKFNIVNEFDMIDMVYTMDIVFIEDITKKEFLDSILKVDSPQLVNCPLFLIIFSFFSPVFHLTSDSNINHILRQ